MLRNHHSPASPTEDDADASSISLAGTHEPYGLHDVLSKERSETCDSSDRRAPVGHNVAGSSSSSSQAKPEGVFYPKDARRTELEPSTVAADSLADERPPVPRGGTVVYNSDHTPVVNPAKDAGGEKEPFQPYMARGRLSTLRFRDIAREHEEQRQREANMLRGGSLWGEDANGRPASKDGDVPVVAERPTANHTSYQAGTAQPLDADNETDADQPPVCVQYRRDITRDGYTWRRIVRTLTYLIEPIYFGVKVAVLVTLPLSILAFYEPVKSHFQAGSLLAVVGTANAQLYVGSQLSGTILVMQGASWIMLWGTIMNCIGVDHNDGAWWGLAFTSVIIVSFFPNFRSRKLMMSYGIIIMQMQRTPGGAAIDRPANVASNLILAVCVSSLQCLLPFPKLVIRQTDKVFADSWNQVGALARRLKKGAWCSGAYGGYVQSVRAACDDLDATIADIPSKLFLITYEPFERSLWNQLRNIRLTLLRRLLVILYAACTAAELVTSMNTPDTRRVRKPVEALLEGPIEEYLEALCFTLKQLGQSLDPARTVAECRFAELLDKKDAALKALQKCLSYVARQDPNTTDAPAFYAYVYFHLLLLMLAEELNTLGDQMAAFDPSQFKSTWRRFLEFFFLDFWNDFCNKLPGRLTLQTQADRRSLKEGIKFACAYCVAAAFTVRLNSDHTADTYFFGMSIILGIGLPTASESIEVGIQRICGMAFALAIGYLAEWKTQNFTQAIAIVVCGAFVGVCFRGTQRYMHVAYYASFIAPAAYGIAKDKITMISRVVDNSFAVMSYLVICAFMFPVNPFRVLWNKRAVIDQSTAELITQLATVSQMPLTEEYEDIAQAKLQIAADKLQTIHVLLNECKTWTGISAKEPVIIGKPFPAEKVSRMQNIMVHLIAGLEVWLFGLQILHRERPHPAQPAVNTMIKVLGPILRDVETVSRYVFQDMIDAVELPLAWSVDRSYRHFSDFVTIKARLDATFHELHKGIMKTQNPDFRRRVVADAMAKGVSLTSPTTGLGNRSFVITSFISPDPRNVRGMPDNGVYDEHDALFPHSINAAAVEDAEAAAARSATPAATGTNHPLGETLLSSPLASNSASSAAVLPSAGYNAADSSGTAAFASTSNTSFTHSPSRRRQSTMRMSFRAPVGNLPVDVDVTAITITIMSIGTLISTLERIIPLISAVNDFERSRWQGAVSGVKEFYMCK